MISGPDHHVTSSSSLFAIFFSLPSTRFQIQIHAVLALGIGGIPDDGVPSVSVEIIQRKIQREMLSSAWIFEAVSRSFGGSVHVELG